MASWQSQDSRWDNETFPKWLNKSELQRSQNIFILSFQTTAKFQTSFLPDPAWQQERKGQITTHPSNLLTVFHIKTRHQERQESCHGHWIHDLSVAVVWTKGQGSFAKMGQTLSNANTKQIIWVLGVVDCQLAQHCSQARIVCTCQTQNTHEMSQHIFNFQLQYKERKTKWGMINLNYKEIYWISKGKKWIKLTSTNDAHGKNWIVGNFCVTVVWEFAEDIKDLKTRIWSGEESKSQRNSSSDNRLTVAQLQTHGEQRHMNSQCDIQFSLICSMKSIQTISWIYGRIKNKKEL